MKKETVKRFIGGVLFCVVVIRTVQVVSSTTLGESPWPTQKWPRSTPAHQKRDPDRLTELVRLICECKEFLELYSFLIDRNGLSLVIDSLRSRQGGFLELVNRKLIKK